LLAAALAALPFFPVFCSLQVLAWYWPPVAFVVLISVLVGLYHEYLQPLGAPNITRDNYTMPFTLTSFALALLLVFRTNSSYDRSASQPTVQMGPAILPLPRFWLLWRHAEAPVSFAAQVVGSSEDVGTATQHHQEPG
jgi:hypothetical protein